MTEFIIKTYQSVLEILSQIDQIVKSFLNPIFHIFENMLDSVLTTLFSLVPSMLLVIKASELQKLEDSLIEQGGQTKETPFFKSAYFIVSTPSIILSLYASFKIFGDCSDTGCILNIIILPVIILLVSLITYVIMVSSFHARRKVLEK